MMALKSLGQRCLQAVLQAGRVSIRSVCSGPSSGKVPRVSGVAGLRSQRNRSCNRPSSFPSYSTSLLKGTQRIASYSTEAAVQGSVDTHAGLYSLVNVKVKGSDEAVLDSYTQFVTRASKILNLSISGRILLPTHIKKHTLLKSPHIYKKHRAQYEVRTHGRLLQLWNITGETADVFLEYIQRNLPEGVSMSVEQTSLETMPDYLQPPPEALAFLQSKETAAA